MAAETLEKLLNEKGNLAEIEELAGSFRRGQLSSKLVSRLLLDMDEAGTLLYGPAIWSTALSLLEADNLDSLRTVLSHLDRFAVYEMDDDDREHYFEHVNKAVDYLVRPYAYLNPEELVLNVAKDVSGDEVNENTVLEEEQMVEIRRLTELIVGGGHYVNVTPPKTMAELIDNIETMVL